MATTTIAGITIAWPHELDGLDLSPLLAPAIIPGGHSVLVAPGSQRLRITESVAAATSDPTAPDHEPPERSHRGREPSQ